MSMVKQLLHPLFLLALYEPHQQLNTKLAGEILFVYIEWRWNVVCSFWPIRHVWVCMTFHKLLK